MTNEPEILLPLQPVQITVNPTPSLIVKYFVETELQVCCDAHSVSSHCMSGMAISTISQSQQHGMTRPSK